MRNWLKTYFHEWFFVATLIDLTLLAYIAWKMHP